MKINVLKSILVMLLVIFFTQLSQAQADQITQTLWYSMDLKDKANAPFFTRQTAKMLFNIPNETKNNETINQTMVQGDLIYSLIGGLRAGILRPFKNDDLRERMTYEEFTGKLDEKRFMETQDYHVLILKKVLRFSKSKQQLLTNDWFSANFVTNEKKYEKEKKSPDYEIEALTILQPNGEPLGTFSFAEVVTNVLLDNEECYYWVSKEKKQFMNMFDALNHGLFEAQLIQYQEIVSNKIVGVKSETDAQKLQSSHAAYPAFASKMVFSYRFSAADVGKVFSAFVKIK